MANDFGSIVNAASSSVDYGSISGAATASVDYGSIVALFPDLPGITWKVKRVPMWSTLIQTAASGKETRAGLWSAPRYKWTLELEFLRSAATWRELQALLGFFNDRRGSLLPWYFRDEDDCRVEGQLIGYGDGVTTDFQMVRSLGYAQTEPVKTVEDGATIYLDAVAAAAGDYSISEAGLLQFGAAPALGALISADFDYLWKVRFAEDQADFERFLYQLWEAKTVEFISEK